MSYDNRRGSGYPPDDDRPPRRDRRPPSRRDYDDYEERDSRRMEGFEVPDLRQRSSRYRARSTEGRDLDYGDDEYIERKAKDTGKKEGRRFFGLSGMDMVFMGALLVAAMRGRGRNSGCLPGRSCLNILLLNIAGVALMIGSIVVYGSDETKGTMAGWMAGGGALLCLAGSGGIILLLWATMRMIDFSGLDDGVDDITGGIFGSIFGGR